MIISIRVLYLGFLGLVRYAPASILKFGSLLTGLSAFCNLLERNTADNIQGLVYKNENQHGNITLKGLISKKKKKGKMVTSREANEASQHQLGHRSR